MTGLYVFLLVQHAGFSMCSFMAFGPPASPQALYMNSSAETVEQLRLNPPHRETLRYSNVSTETFLNDLTDGTDEDGDYWFLRDQNFKHAVSIIYHI
jgi:hypothetical protein